MRFVNVTRDPAEKVGAKLKSRVFVIGGVLTMLAGIGMALACVITKFYEPIGGASVFVVTGVLLIVAGTVGRPFVTKWLERRELVRTKTCAVTFSEDRFEVACYANRKNSGSYSYDELAVTDYPTVWVLEYGEKRWVTLRKLDMTEGTQEELSEFLEGKLRERYRNENREIDN